MTDTTLLGDRPAARRDGGTPGVLRRELSTALTALALLIMLGLPH